MPRSVRIGIIGDRHPEYATHVGTDGAFAHAQDHLGIDVRAEWVPTESLSSGSAHGLDRFDALLIAPGSPYRNREGALSAIRWARESEVPLLGTCGGFQHMIVEFARNVLGVADADHAEDRPTAEHLYVTPLACSLVGTTDSVRLSPGSRAYRAYGRSESREQFYCNFGLNPSHREEVEKGGFETSGVDRTGEVRIMELPGHRNYLGTLFVPQMASTPEHPHPLILSLVTAASGSDAGAGPLDRSPDARPSHREG